jgi:hypothetical protein
MPLQETSGNLTTDAFGGGAAAAGPAYIENVFSTWLYTGTGASQTITNNIDVSTKGGMLWIKQRSGTVNNAVTDTARGYGNVLVTDLTIANSALQSAYQDWTTTGFGVTSSGNYNASGQTYASWTFCKQPKFFTVGTYSGNGTTQAITHDLGSAPGCVIVKNTTTAGSWIVYHSGLTSGYYIQLNGTGAQDNTNAARRFGNNSTTVNPTSTTITVGDLINTSGDTWVYYAFASNAGGFGLTGTDNVISCGSYTGTGASGNAVTLGYEPQWLLVKEAAGTNAASNNWILLDTMRGMNVNNGAASYLFPNSSSAESSGNIGLGPTATGFVTNGGGSSINENGGTYIYIAIRRGPMKVPTDATKVFSPIARTGTSANAVITTPNFVVDSTWIQQRQSGWQASKFFDRLRGATNLLYSNTTSAEVSDAYTLTSFASNVGFSLGSDVDNYSVNTSPNTYINYAFQRAPSFFDEVCSNGFVDGTLINHNLGVTPELIIVKTRNVASNWMGAVNEAGNIRNISINTTSGGYLPSLVYSSYFNSTTINPAGILNGAGGSSKGSGVNVVIYLFATCAGVSKVGSYTGNGTTQTINCGFTGGARFVLIKRTDSTGDWYVYDTARGMTTLTDPYLLLDTTAAEVATLGSVTTVSTGFALNAAILAAINTSSATYIFLAIA